MSDLFCSATLVLARHAKAAFVEDWFSDEGGSLTPAGRIQAHRLAEACVVVGVHCCAGEPYAVRADGRVAPRPAAPRRAVGADRAGVDGPETRGGEGHEHGRMFGDGVGDAFPAA